jgi:hypothetical protein
MDKTIVHLIQGFFFAEGQRLAFAYGRDGAQVVVKHVVEHAMFAGVFGPDPTNPGVQVGRMSDHYGESVLRAILFEGDSFNFVKYYEHREDHIDYRFTRGKDGIWTGTFEGKVTGKGKARCILTHVPETFLFPPEFSRRKPKLRAVR